jgi:hypothetical protein
MLASAAEKPVRALKPTHNTFNSHQHGVIAVRTRLLGSHYRHTVAARWLPRTNGCAAYEIKRQRRIPGLRRKYNQLVIGVTVALKD